MNMQQCIMGFKGVTKHFKIKTVVILITKSKAHTAYNQATLAYAIQWL